MIFSIIIASLFTPVTSVPEVLDSAVIVAEHIRKEVPMTFSEMKSEELEKEQSSYSLPMKLGLLPSVVSTSEGGTGLGYSNIRIRGIGAYHTNVTLNGITLNDAESQEVFWVNIPAISSILESVTVQRGLGTSSNGPGAFGASINMDSFTDHGKEGGNAEISYGSFNTFTGSISVSSGRTAKGFWAQGTYNYQHSDGYIRNSMANVHSIYASAGWSGEKDSFRFTFLQGIQCTGITWNGVPFDKYDSDRTFNICGPGDTDNYRQGHFQLKYIHSFNGNLSLDATLNYTPGYGYYRIDGENDHLKNRLGVLKADLIYDNRTLRINSGVYLSAYKGLHYGNTYSNDAIKKELDVFVRGEFKLPCRLLLFGDIQYRTLRYSMKGPDEYGHNLDMDKSFGFFNPRAGVSWIPFKNSKIYASVAFGNREPARADYQADPGVRPEKMRDWEAGAELSWKIFSAGINLYWMRYTDMLVETGELDASGYAIKTNISGGLRRGVELSGKINVRDFFSFENNFTFSSSRTSEGNPMLLSPDFVGMFGISCRKLLGTRIGVTHKFVGKQFWDNSGNSGHLIPAYNTATLSIDRDFYPGKGIMNISFVIDNLWNNFYYSYAYAWGVFPQPPRTVCVRVRYNL